MAVIWDKVMKMAFKLVVSDPKTRKSYQREVSPEGLLGKKIGEKVSGSIAGLAGYELEITGGSDKDGFPMRKDVEGAARKKILISGPPGFKPKVRGQRKRKSVRGNTISEDIVQINTKVVKYGSKGLEQLLAKKPEEKDKGKEKAEEKPEEKEKPAEAEGKGEEKPKEEKRPSEAESKEEEGKAAEKAEKPAEEKTAPTEEKEEKPGKKPEEVSKEEKPEGKVAEEEPAEKPAHEKEGEKAEAEQEKPAEAEKSESEPASEGDEKPEKSAAKEAPGEP